MMSIQWLMMAVDNLCGMVRDVQVVYLEGSGEKETQLVVYYELKPHPLLQHST